MNIREVKLALPILMKHKIVPFLHGAQGRGKTQVVKQLAGKKGFVHLHLATQEVGDLVGLLVPNADGTVAHARPEWFPTEGEGIVFLDELNRAHPDVIQAMFSFITEGTIHRHRLPKGWSIVAAGNYSTNQFNVTDTSDAAWLSRFCHIDFNPTVEEFITYAEDAGAFGVASFIREQPNLLEQKIKEGFNHQVVTPDRRAYFDMIAPLEREEAIEPVRFEVYSGLIGQAAASAFLTHKKTAQNRISGRQVVFEYPKVRSRVIDSSDTKKVRFDLLSGAVEEILAHLPGKELPHEHLNNLKAFILDIPLELGLKFLTAMEDLEWAQKNLILNNKEFVATFKKLKK